MKKHYIVEVAVEDEGRLSSSLRDFARVIPLATKRLLVSIRDTNGKTWQENLKSCQGIRDCGIQLHRAYKRCQSLECAADHSPWQDGEPVIVDDGIWYTEDEILRCIKNGWCRKNVPQYIEEHPEFKAIIESIHNKE